MTATHNRTEDGLAILVLSGSTRAESLNTRLAHLVGRLRPADLVTFGHSLADLPFYDGDLEAADTPPPVRALQDAVKASDLLIVVTPEYNGTIPGLVGNAVDWLSRPYGHCPLTGKAALVLSASPGRGGGGRAASHLRSVLARTGAVVSPHGLSVPNAHQQFDPTADPALQAALTEVLGLAVAGLTRTAA